MRGLIIFLSGLTLSLFVTTAVYSADPVFKKGSGVYEFTGYAPLKDKPVTIYYNIPEGGDIKTMPILFVMHGTGRNGDGYFASWEPFSNIKDFIVLTPTFSKEYYPSRIYHFGGVSKESTKYVAVPQEKWTYNIIESIFDFFKAQTGNTSATYDIWGHSAGGQFVHRFLLWMPDARVNRAVAANPGSWTFPVMEGIKDAQGEVFAWPYSTLGTPITADQLRKFFARKMWVSLGEEDVDLTRKDLPREPGAQAQGNTRLERGKYFFETSKKVAAKMNAPFNWDIAIVEGVGHSGRGMTYGYPGDVVDGKTVYNTANYGKGGGYWILYADR